MGNQRVCEKTMKPEGKFTVTQYAIFAKLSPPFAKTRLNELVKAGLAKKLWTGDSVQSRDKLYLVTTIFHFKPTILLNLHKRKEKPSDPNAWMRGVH
jgi:hypothetical protein